MGVALPVESVASHHPAFLYAPGLQEGNQESHTMTTDFFQFSKGVGAEATESGESASSVLVSSVFVARRERGEISTFVARGEERKLSEKYGNPELLSAK